MKHSVDEVLAGISSAHLANLASAVGAGWVYGDSPVAALAPFAGENAKHLVDWLRTMEETGFSPEQLERLLHAVVNGRTRDQVLMPDLVVSGPDLPGIPTADTHAAVQSMFQEAETEVVLAGYAFHNGRLLFERLAEHVKKKPHLRLIFHVDVPRRQGDSSLAEAIVRRHADEFRERHWPWSPYPEVYYDPRALETNAKTRASMHAKVLAIDRRKILLTSANFTEAAQQRNIEMGLLCNAPYLVEQVCSYFEGLRNTGRLVRLP